MLVFHYKFIFIWYSSLVKMYGSRHLIETGWKVIEIALYGLFDGYETNEPIYLVSDLEKDGSRIGGR